MSISTGINPAPEQLLRCCRQRPERHTDCTHGKITVLITGNVWWLYQLHQFPTVIIIIIIISCTIEHQYWYQSSSRTKSQLLRCCRLRPERHTDRTCDKITGRQCVGIISTSSVSNCHHHHHHQLYHEYLYWYQSSSRTKSCLSRCCRQETRTSHGLYTLQITCNVVILSTWSVSNRHHYHQHWPEYKSSCWLPWTHHVHVVKNSVHNALMTSTW